MDPSEQNPHPEPPEDEVRWYVAHTRPRCEKKLAGYCAREGIEVTMPTYRSVKKYPGKVVTFQKPLFPNYLFFKLTRDQTKIVYQSDYVANLLHVTDQQTFEEQLANILEALETDYEVCLLPHITAGKRVKIKTGPLRGMEGFVENRQGTVLVVLRLDFISQSAGVKIDVSELEVVD